jgi:uncharacterized membrane protein YhaH (DUF805 family)
MLLAGQLNTGVGKSFRVLYYATLVWATLWAAVGTSITLSSKITLANVTLAIAMIIVVGVLPALGLYHLAILVDRWRDKKLTSSALARHASTGPTHGLPWSLPHNSPLDN